MLRSTFLMLLIHLGPSSLNESWHIYKIVEPVVLNGMVFLSSYRMIRGKNLKTVWQVVQNEETG